MWGSNNDLLALHEDDNVSPSSYTCTITIQVEFLGDSSPQSPHGSYTTDLLIATAEGLLYVPYQSTFIKLRIYVLSWSSYYL